jgi:hypothetical protein
MTNLETNTKKEIIDFVAVLHLKRGNYNMIMAWIIGKPHHQMGSWLGSVVILIYSHLNVWTPV